MRRAKAGQLEPVLLVARQQTAGRGRLGRSWLSQAPSGDQELACLTFSLGLPMAPRDWSGLSLAVGLSLAQSLHPDLRLKWPNDLWWQGRKLAGILIETANLGDTRYAVIGVGINLLEPQAAGLSTPAAWLTQIVPELSGGQALLRLMPALVQTLKEFEVQGFAPLQGQFNQRDALAGLNVGLSDGLTGVAQGVDATGALQVQTAQGLKKINSAEVSVRPVLPAGRAGV
jgi:BirA family biotin operon repressor/biotin-[acetyl-CoA-carboxylase] ligase